MMTGVVGGFSGSLSTVSTFVAEILDKIEPIRVPGKELAWRRSGAFYALVTVIVGGLIPVCLSLWARWTH